MSSTPRSRSLSGMLFALLVVAILVAAFLVAIAAGLNPATAVSRVVDSFFPPPAVTEQGVAIRELYNIVFWIGAVIFFVVEGLILWTVLRYKRRPGDDTLPPQTHGNMLAEALWTIIPTIIVGFLFVISWQTLNKVEALSEQPDVKVRAFAAQFQWQFDYYDQNDEIVFTQLLPVGEDGGLAVPVGRNIRLLLESPDVIHSFYVPQFLFKRDVVPGRVNSFEFTLNESDAGNTFHGQCAELCGTGHRIMLFDVNAMTRADFDAWLAGLVEAANATPPPAPSGAPVIDVVAKDIAYDKLELQAPADTPFVIHFENQDAAAITHDIDVKSPDGSSVIQDQDPIPGQDETDYTFEPLAAGTYPFFCSIHPSVPAMNGTLTVQ
jgi:cytochrome c oxidase subunit II